MKSLIRHDLRWALPLALLGTLVHLLAMVLNYQPASFWIFPENKYLEVGLGFHATAAMVVGLWTLFFDDLLRTREYLLHRAQSFRRIFWLRHAIGLGTVALWVLLVPTLHLLGTKLLSPNAPLVNESRWGLYVAQGVPSFLFYALAVFLGSVTQTILRGVVLAIVGEAVAVAAIAMALVAGPYLDLIWVLGLCLMLTPFLLIGAERNQSQGRDPDRPWLSRRLAFSGTAFLLVATVVGTLTLTLGQLIARIGLLDTYPKIHESNGAAVLIKWSDHDGAWRRVDQQHVPQEVLPANPPELFAPDRFLGFLPLSPSPRHTVFPYGERFRGQSYLRLPGMGPAAFNRPQGYLGQDGYLHLYRLAARRGDSAPGMRRLGKVPEGRPFSSRTRIVDTWLRIVLLVDPEDGGIWAYDLDGDAPGFSRIELPGGDRFVEVQTLMRSPGFKGGYVPMPLTVLGERGTYLWKDGRFVGADAVTLQPAGAGQPGGSPSSLSPFERRPGRPHADVAVEGASGLRVSLRVPGGKMFHYTYRPHTVREHAAVLAQRVVSLLRPTIVTGASLLSANRGLELGSALMFDRAVMMGERAVVAGNLLVTLLLAALAFRRLGRLGVPRRRRLYWATAVLLGGATLYLCHLMIEQRRAWKPMPAEPEGRTAPSGLLVQSA